MKKLDDLAPAGLSARREIGWVLAAYALAGLWSLTFLVRYFGRRENLFIVKAGRRVLQAGARMEPFLEVLDGALLGFAAAALLMAGLALWHLLYHYQGSRSIDLMRRLPRRSELPVRCLAVPVAGALGAGALAAIFLGVYWMVYRLCTPAAALPGPF